MGIENINRAKCDICGYEEFSNLKQSAFLDELKSKGWAGTITKIKCPKCANAKVFEGHIDSIKKAGHTYFVKISNNKVDVYLRYQDLKPLGGNEIPTKESLKKHFEKLGKDPEHIKYTNVKKVKVANTTMLLAEKFDG